MLKFKVGSTYTCTSACDHNTTWTYTVVSRTACTITVRSDIGAETFRIIKGVSQYRGAESIYPLGKYSLCPILSADNER